MNRTHRTICHQKKIQTKHPTCCVQTSIQHSCLKPLFFHIDESLYCQHVQPFYTNYAFKHNHSLILSNFLSDSKRTLLLYQTSSYIQFKHIFSHQLARTIRRHATMSDPFSYIYKERRERQENQKQIETVGNFLSVFNVALCLALIVTSLWKIWEKF